MPDPLPPLFRRPRRRLAVSPVLTAVGILLLYVVLPMRGGTVLVAAVVIPLASLGAFLWMVVQQANRIADSPHPMRAAVEAMSLLGTMFVVSFSVSYLALADSDPAAFNQPMDKVGALYFTMSIMSTVGFGDFVAVSDLARLTVVVEMTANLVLIALVGRLVWGVATWARTQREAEAKGISPDSNSQ